MIAPVGIPIIVPRLTYGAIKKLPIQIPSSVVNSINVLGRKTTESVCESFCIDIWNQNKDSNYQVGLTKETSYSYYNSIMTIQYYR